MKFRKALQEKQSKKFYKILMGLSIEELINFKEVIENIIETKTSQNKAKTSQN